MTTLAQILGRFYISNALDDFSVGGTALSLDTGYYYLAQYSGETTEQLCEHMQAVIRAGTAYSSATVTYSGSTGVVTINIGATATLDFDDTGLAAILGFSATSYSGASSYSSNQVPQHVWRPTISLSDHYGEKKNLWAPRSTSRVVRSANGTTYSIVGNELFDVVLTWNILPKEDVITPADGTVYRDYEQFYRDVIHEGQPMRVYHDRTLNSVDDFKTAIFGSDDQDIVGSISEYVARYTPDYNGHWSVTIPLMEFNQ